ADRGPVCPAARERNPQMTRGQRKVMDLSIDIGLALFGLLMLAPLVMLVANAFKTPAEMVAWPPTFIPSDPTLDNFRAVLVVPPVLLWIWNALSFAILSTIAIVLTSSIAGYIIA